MQEYNNTLPVSQNLIDLFFKYGQKQTFNSKAHLIYTGHIPIVAYMLYKGTIILTDKSKECLTFTQPTIIGLKELLSSSKYRCDAEVQEGSIICSMDRSAVKKIRESDEIINNELNLLESYSITLVS